jgi:hypothetical protein
MGEKIKYLAVLLVAIAVSALTSYATTLSLQPKASIQQPSNSPELTPQSSSSPSPQPTSTKITASYNAYFDPEDNQSVLTVYSNETIHNLTVTYQFTSLNGTNYTTKINYGTYTPAFSPNHVIEVGDTPFQLYRIPQSIISACSTTKLTFDSHGYASGITWDIYPKLTVTEFYGYS